MATSHPVVIIGCNRSGTSVVTRMLKEAGLFVGGRLDANFEARFFFQLNDWILHGAGASRAWPAKVSDINADPAARAAIVEYLRYMVSSPRAAMFMGAGKYANVRDLRRLNIPWGWKDPSNTFTFPVWQEIFGEARVLSVIRHPADVISSMRSMHRSSVSTDLQQFRRYRWIFPFRPKRSGFASFSRLLDSDSAWIWYEEHFRQCNQVVASMGSEAMEVRFEDLASDPATVLKSIVSFCALQTPAVKIEEIAAGFRPKRALTFSKEPDLVEQSRVRDELLATWGYSSDQVARYVQLIHGG